MREPEGLLEAASGQGIPYVDFFMLEWRHHNRIVRIPQKVRDGQRFMSELSMAPNHLGIRIFGEQLF